MIIRTTCCFVSFPDSAIVTLYPSWSVIYVLVLEGVILSGSTLFVKVKTIHRDRNTSHIHNLYLYGMYMLPCPIDLIFGVNIHLRSCFV